MSFQDNLIELKTQSAPTAGFEENDEGETPDEVKNNFITQSTQITKPIQSTTSEKDDLFSEEIHPNYVEPKLKKHFKFFIIVIMCIVNIIPLPLTFAEAVLRSVINYSYKASLPAQIFFYFYLLAVLIIFSEVSDKKCRFEGGGGAISIFILAMFFILIAEFGEYFRDIDEINEYRSFIKILIKFRIIMYFIGGGIDILFMATSWYFFAEEFETGGDD